MVDEIKETKEEEKEELVWDPAFPKCPKCGYPLAQPPKCIHCGQIIEEPPETPVEPEGVIPKGGEGKPEDELLKKTRDELNVLAEEKGLTPGDYRKKEEIVKAILEAEE